MISANTLSGDRHAGAPPLGRLLKHWRALRGLSQLELALSADVSSRHLSFIESGRTSPSREMVLRLATTLEVPLRERNDLLEAAGFARLYRETVLSAPELEQARRAIELILARQEPYPAVVMDRSWNLVESNQGARRFFGKVLGEGTQAPTNILRLVFHPSYLRPWISNWAEVACSLLGRVRREAVGGVLDEGCEALLLEVLAYPDVPQSIASAAGEAPIGPLVPLHFHKGDLRLSFFSTVTSLGTPADITLQELRVECFFPADRETEELALLL